MGAKAILAFNIGTAAGTVATFAGTWIECGVGRALIVLGALTYATAVIAAAFVLALTRREA